MNRFGVVLVVVTLGLLLPSHGGSSASRRTAEVKEPPWAKAPPLDAAGVSSRGPTRELVALWTPSIPRKRRGKPAPALSPEREIVLTFDDGPDLHTTPLVLAELKKRQLKAIFFVAGRRLVAGGKRGRIQRELVREMVREGHLVANHTIHHVHLCDRPHRIAAELDGNARIIRNTAGVEAAMFRAPFGDRCAELDDAMAARGLVNVGWSIDPQDWRRIDPAEVTSYVKKKLEQLPGKAVLLLHDTRRAGTLALPAILDHIEAMNRRAAAGQGRPIHIREPRVLMPDREVPTTGLEALAAHVARDIAALPDLLAPATRP